MPRVGRPNSANHIDKEQGISLVVDFASAVLPQPTSRAWQWIVLSCPARWTPQKLAKCSRLLILEVSQFTKSKSTFLLSKVGRRKNQNVSKHRGCGSGCHFQAGILLPADSKPYLAPGLQIIYLPALLQYPAIAIKSFSALCPPALRLSFALYLLRVARLCSTSVLTWEM